MAATYLTHAGVEKLQKELEELKRQKRRLSEEVGKAREHGDLKENAEYHAAKERLQQVLQKIDELQLKLTHVQMIDPTQVEKGVATLGMRVTVKDLTRDKEETYILVGPDESDPATGRISMASPLGKAFLGRKVNEKVSAVLPVGVRPYQILTIEPAT